MGIIDRIKIWISMFKPEGTDAVLKQYKGKGDLKESLINYLIGSAIISAAVFILYLVLILLFAGMFEAIIATSGVDMDTGISFIMAVIIAAAIAIASFILTPIMGYITQGIYWVIAKVLGGNGTYTEQTFFGSMLSGAFAIITPAIIVISFIPCLGTLISLAIVIYELYLAYRIIKTVHKLDELRAAVVVILPLLAAVAIYVLIYIFTLASYGTSSMYVD